MSELCDAILHITEAVCPRTLLAVGAAASGCLGGYAEAHRDCRLEPLEGEDVPARLARLGRYDLALVAGVLEPLPVQAGAALLARLRDVHARRLLVLVRDGAGAWDESALRGYGLRPAGSWGGAGGTTCLYEFDLYDYKTTPDWLNAKHWAHPELWDKYRW